MNQVIVLVVGFLVVLSAQLSEQTAWRDCGSQSGKVIKVEVGGCEKKHRCLLNRGKNETLEIVFDAHDFTRGVHADVFGIIGGLPVPYPIAKKDACKSGLLSCPLMPQKRYVYKNALFVEQAYPKISLVVKWILKDTNNKNLACLLIPVKIV